MLSRQPISPRPTAFTLIELLVVISIVALLVAILLPSLQKARDKANQVRAASNIRQFGIGVRLYGQDHKNRLPGRDASAFGAWAFPVKPYLATDDVYMMPTTCPGLALASNPKDRREGLIANINLIGNNNLNATIRRRPEEARDPHGVFLFTHGPAISSWGSTHIDNGLIAGTYIPALNSRGLNFYFLDDHVEFVPFLGPGASRWWLPSLYPAVNPWIYKGRMYGP